MKRVALSILAASVLLAGCSTAPTATPQETADKITLAYLPIRTLASLCAAGISKPCQDPNVSANVAKALPLADAAVDEAVRQITANPDRSNVAKWSSYAMSAISILTKALATYNVKTG